MICILSIQGGVEEHEAVLQSLGLPFKRVRSLKDVDGLTGLILPGGESTVMRLFLKEYGLDEWLVRQTFPIYGTCAGLIVLSALGLLNVKGHRLTGGMRASIYNAMPVEGVKKLCDYMKEFGVHNR